VKIDFEGATWKVEFLDADMIQADAIAAYTGLSLMGWYRSLLDTDGAAWNKSVRCLYWLMLAQNPQNGEFVPLNGTLNFKPLQLFAAFSDAMAAERAEAAGVPEDPTRPVGGSGAGEPSLPAERPAG
jgi:hypothetical protein